MYIYGIEHCTRSLFGRKSSRRRPVARDIFKGETQRTIGPSPFVSRVNNAKALRGMELGETSTRFINTEPRTRPKPMKS
jgi:hypothetical protein